MPYYCWGCAVTVTARSSHADPSGPVHRFADRNLLPFLLLIGSLPTPAESNAKFLFYLLPLKNLWAIDRIRAGVFLRIGDGYAMVAQEQTEQLTGPCDGIFLLSKG
ncbi:hypothetical protein Poly41_26520 [Novipirellula artificiosorum]|uniref:Uncharacterized protein n=1 Tax=Novipirellula artificiosorum TaxID=2528016 RepID=A0A5C6DXM6_9BACT|nr:hypothetical protein Poly41_26520 [Novipirellula artificiosorum]